MRRFHDPPTEFQFTGTLYQQMAASFWAAPLWRLLHNDLRRWPNHVASLIPVLAVRRIPGNNLRRRGGEIAQFFENVVGTSIVPGEARDGNPDWTGWAYQSQREKAALAGLDCRTVRKAQQWLKEHGYLNSYRLRHHGRTFDFERLRAGGVLYPYQQRNGIDGKPHYSERFVRFPAQVIYSGNWALIPTESTRKLLLMLAALDPVFWTEQEGKAKNPAAAMQRKRNAQRVSLSKVRVLSGLSRSTFIAAKQILTTPGPRGALVTLKGQNAGVVSVAVNWSVLCHPLTDWQTLNDPEALSELRLDWWGDTRWGRQRPASVPVTIELRESL